MDRGGLIDEEAVTAEAAIAFPTVGVEDPKRRPPPRRAVAVPGNQGLGPLADDVSPQADPRPACQLQPETGGFGHDSGQASGETRRLEDDEQRLRSSGKSRQATQPVGDGGRPIRGGETAAGQVQDQEVHRASGQEHAADGQALVERLGRDDHQPLEPNTPGNGFDRIEAPAEIHPGHDGARCLGLRGQPEDERGPATGAVAADGDARRPRQATGSQDRVQRREPRPDDPLVRGEDRFGVRRARRFRRHGGVRGRRKGQRPFGDPRSCRSPSSLEARHGCRHVRGECRHSVILEHLFYYNQEQDIGACFALIHGGFQRGTKRNLG
jgi:hypothetical protein